MWITDYYCCVHELYKYTFVIPLVIFPINRDYLVSSLFLNRPFSTFNVMELLGRVCIKCQTSRIVINSFGVTGIHMNKNKFTSVEYIEEANKVLKLSFY